MGFATPRAESAAVAAPASVIISILNWNCTDMTLACLASLTALRLDSAVKVSVVVIDNGSKEADFLHLQQGIAAQEITLLPRQGLDRDSLRTPPGQPVI